MVSEHATILYALKQSGADVINLTVLTTSGVIKFPHPPRKFAEPHSEWHDTHF